MVFNASDPSGAGGLGCRCTGDRIGRRAHVAGCDRRLCARHRRDLRPLRLRRRRRGGAGAHHPGRRAGAGYQGRLRRQPREPRHHRRDRRRLRRSAADRLHAQPFVVGRSTDRRLPRRLPRTDAAADHRVGGKPQHAVALAAARLEQRPQPHRARHRQGRRAKWACPTRWSPAFRCPSSSSTTCWPRRRRCWPAKSSSASRPCSPAPATRCRRRWPRWLASGTDLAAAATEALAYLDRCLDAGFRPGMGNVRARPPVLGPARRRDDDERRPTTQRRPCTSSTCPPHDTNH